MTKPSHIDLGHGVCAQILYEDRTVLALDKPAGWLLAPGDWDRTGRHLQNTLEAGIRDGSFWARSRQLRYLRFVHRLDADTSGVLLLVKSPGALPIYSRLFATHRVQKEYLAVVEGVPAKPQWTSTFPLAPDPGLPGRMHVNTRDGKPAETHFERLETVGNFSLVRVKPLTGRTHQIRVHLQSIGCPIVGDTIYGPKGWQKPAGLIRLFLHAYKLEFVTQEGKSLVLECDLPQDLQKVLSMLE